MRKVTVHCFCGVPLAYLAYFFCARAIELHRLIPRRACIHPAQWQHSDFTLTANVEGATHHGGRYALSQSVVTGPEDLPGVHAKHKQRTAVHVARLVGNREKMTRLQGIGSVPPLLRQAS
jgi:hypothetical protein